jgi:hypothetical protein
MQAEEWVESRNDSAVIQANFKHCLNAVGIQQ